MNRIIEVSNDRMILAIGSDNVMKVKNINNKNTTNGLPCVIQTEGSIQMIKISPDNNFVAWITKQPIVVWVKSIGREEYFIKVENDKAGIGFKAITWSLDSQFLLVLSKLSVYTNVINITEKTMFKINGAIKGSFKKNVCSFSPDGVYFASAERSHPATISIYTADDWIKVQVLKINGISNIGGMIWCQDSMSFFIWESLTHYQVTHFTLDGRVEHETKRDFTLVSSIAVAPNGRVIAIQSDDFKISITDLLTWNEEALFSHESVLHNKDISFLKESLLNQQENSSFLQSKCVEVKDSFVALDPSRELHTLKRALEFSACSTFLATYEPKVGEALWIWSLTKKNYLHSIILLDKTISTVNRIIWHPNKLQLLVDIGLCKVLVWDLETCFVISSRDTATTIFNSNLYLATLSLVQENNDDDDNGS